MEEFSFTGYGGVSLFGRHWQSQEPKAALLIVHGIGEHSRRYSDMAEFLVTRGISVMSFDLRGHGLSEGKRGLIVRWDEFRNDLKSACMEISGRYPTIPFFILGHSMGGTISLDYLLNSDFLPRGMIVSAPSLSAPGLSPILLRIAAFLSRVTPGLILNTGIDSNVLSRDAGECRKYQEDPLVHGKACARLSTELESAQQRILEKAGEAGVPLLVCYGSDDSLVPPGAIDQFFAKAGSKDKTLKVFDGAYHEIHNDFNREEVYRLYSDWILARI